MFAGKYHKNSGYSMAMLVYRSVKLPPFHSSMNILPFPSGFVAHHHQYQSAPIDPNLSHEAELVSTYLDIRRFLCIKETLGKSLLNFTRSGVFGLFDFFSDFCVLSEVRFLLEI